MAEAQVRVSSRDIPGRLREYETIYILRPELTTLQITEVNKRVRGIIEKEGGALISVDNWGKKKLAYPVKKNHRGVYLYWKYLGAPALVPELERNLKLMDQVIRYYTVLVAENVDVQGRETGVTDESFEAASEYTPDEEALATGQATTSEDGEGGEGAEGETAAAGEGAEASAPTEEAEKSAE